MTHHQGGASTFGQTFGGGKGGGGFGSTPTYHFTNLLPGRIQQQQQQQQHLQQSHAGVIPPYSDFLEIPVDLFAQQLTKMDYELFKRVIPHQCLGSVW